MEEKKKKEKGKKPRPQRPIWGTQVGEFCQVIAYGNADVEKIFNFDRERYFNDPQYKEDLLKLANNFIQPSQEYYTKDPIYTGIKYQCVEYARRFMIINQDCTIQEIDFAWQIFDLQEVQDLKEKDKMVEFKGFKNGESDEKPQIGDYLIFSKSDNQPYGHIAVISNTNLTSNPFFIDVVEQNYHNRLWPEKDFSRRILVEIRDGKYYITNKTINKQYPKVLEHSDSEDSDEEGIIGFKRIKRNLKYFNQKN